MAGSLWVTSSSQCSWGQGLTFYGFQSSSSISFGGGEPKRDGRGRMLSTRCVCVGGGRCANLLVPALSPGQTKELEIKDTTDKPSSASYLDLRLEIDNRGRLSTKLYDKRDDFTFPIVNFPFLCGNIPAAPAYGVYISQLIRYSRACDVYHDFLSRARLLTNKLLTQGFVAMRLKSSLLKFFGRHHELVDRYETAVAKMQSDLFLS